MIKLGAFLAHQPPDVGNAKRLFADAWHRSRQLLDNVINGVRSAKGRIEVNGLKVEPRAVCIASRSVLQATTKPNSGIQTFLTSWENVVNGYLTRHVGNGLASRAHSAGVFQGLVLSAARSHVRYDGLAQRVMRYGFVGIGIAAGSQMQDFYNSDTVADGIFGELRNMFAVKNNEFSTDQSDVRTVKLEEIEFGDVVGGGWNAAIFTARLAMPEQNEVENVVAVLPEIEEPQQDAGIIIPVEDHTESLIADAMEDMEVSFEEVLKETMETVKEQHNELSRLRTTVSSQALQLRNLCGQGAGLPELLKSLEGLKALDEDAVDGFTVLLLDEMRMDEVETPLVTEDAAVDHDDVSSVRSSLSSLSESLDELESAVSLVEQQHLELANLRHLLLIQNAVLHGLLAPADLLDEGLPKTRMKAVDAAAENGMFNEMVELDDENAMAIDKKLDLELDVDAFYEFAVKVCPLMMSCSADHARRMLRKELMPAMRGLVKFGDKSVLDMWHFPAHFNIVELYGGYVEPLCDVRALENLSPPGVQHWPVVENLNQGCAVCVVMKRYEFTLAEFLASHSPGILESSLLMLQLLEAVVHLGMNGICHRNLNTNNILVETTSSGYHLVISDFSQCICGDGLFGLHVPYVTDETYKGGCLLAPEIDNAERFSVLNYRKADLWAVGAIAYEIFGGKNPFGRSGGLLAASYSEQDLPDLPSHVPEFISCLVKSMLRRNPNERPEPVNIADALHVLLWAPKEWITSWEHGDQTFPKEVEIRRWIVQFGAVVRCGMFGKKDASVVETLQKMFLSRCDPRLIRDTVRLLWH